MTTRDISDSELDLIDHSCQATTDGNWRLTNHGTWEVEAQPNQRIADFGTIGHARLDATFVAMAKNAVPLLTAEIRRLRQTLRSPLAILAMGNVERADLVFSRGFRAGNAEGAKTGADKMRDYVVTRLRAMEAGYDDDDGANVRETVSMIANIVAEYDSEEIVRRP